LAERTALQWECDLADRGLMVCAVRDIGGFVAAQAAHGLDLVETTTVPGLGDCPLVRIPGAPAWTRCEAMPRAPEIGEHGRAILAEAGIAPDQIEQILSTALPSRA
jgi:crotonobetainyl-CoA:carnitine CoA-transferase CaiB-like acyl-CoA transferase